MTEAIEYRGFTIRIEQDTCDESPRDWDNLARIWCWHGRYVLGDEKDPWAEMWFDTGGDGDSMYRMIMNEFAPVVIEPLGLLDHSGLALYKGHDAHWCDPGGWDSGAIGWAFIARDDLLREFERERLSQKLRATAQRILDDEIEAYGKFLSGDVWGYIITYEGEHVDSCWNYYGYDYCKKEAKLAADFFAPQYEAEAKTLSDEPIGDYVVSPELDSQEGNR
jgi:hypothetical protein